jgi:hypothetical protein
LLSKSIADGQRDAGQQDNCPAAYDGSLEHEILPIPATSPNVTVIRRQSVVDGRMAQISEAIVNAKV